MRKTMCEKQHRIRKGGELKRPIMINNSARIKARTSAAHEKFVGKQ